MTHVLKRSDAISFATSQLDGMARSYDEDRPMPGLLGDRVLPQLTLPRPSAPSYDYRQTQDRRHSTHTYSTETISLSDFHQICSHAQNAEPNLSLMLIVSSVDGLVPGVYVYHDHAVSLVRAVDTQSREREEWVLQREFAHVPLVLVVCGSVARCERNGTHAYRDLMVRAGNMCQDAWLTAVSIGLAGVMFAGLLHAGLKSLGLDGWQKTGLVGLAIGHPEYSESVTLMGGDNGGNH